MSCGDNISQSIAWWFLPAIIFGCFKISSTYYSISFIIVSHNLWHSLIRIFFVSFYQIGNWKEKTAWKLRKSCWIGMQIGEIGNTSGATKNETSICDMQYYIFFSILLFHVCQMKKIHTKKMLQRPTDEW